MTSLNQESMTHINQASVSIKLTNQVIPIDIKVSTIKKRMGANLIGKEK